jgi:hypothetical protein
MCEFAIGLGKQTKNPNILTLLDEEILVIAPSGLLHMEFLLCLYSHKNACYYGRRFF